MFTYLPVSFFLHLSPPNLYTGFPSFSPTLISRMVSVDIKPHHHVYLLTYLLSFAISFSPLPLYHLPLLLPVLNLVISLTVSVDVKHHVYLLTYLLSPSLSSPPPPTSILPPPPPPLLPIPNKPYGFCGR